MQGITVTLEELLSLRFSANQFNLPQQKKSYGSQLGDYQSPFRGRGMNFVETRIYEPGDDVRMINWAVTARTGKPHTKIYQQERERPIYIIIDFNQTMFFGTKKAFKSVIAAQVASLIAWAALKNGDRIGALLIKDSFKIIPPCHSKQTLMELLKHIVSYAAPVTMSKSDAHEAFVKLKRIIKSGSLIYYLSDFYRFDDALKNDLQQLAQRNDVTNVLIYDQIEKNPPKEGRYLFHDISQNHCLLADTSSKAYCTEYRDIFQSRLESIKKLSHTSGMRFVELRTSDDVVAAVRHLLSWKP